VAGGLLAVAGGLLAVAGGLLAVAGGRRPPARLDSLLISNAVVAWFLATTST
jgi:hypothetical protein